MKWLIQNHRKIYCFLTGLTVVLVALSAAGNDLASTLAAACLFLLVFYLVVGGRRMAKAVGTGLPEYYQNCDPQPLLDNCERLLDGASDHCRSDYVLTLRCYRAGVLVSLGREWEAEEELDRIRAVLPEKKVNETSLTCRVERVAVNLRADLLAGLEHELEAIRKLLPGVRVPSLFAGMTFPELMEWRVERCSCDLLLRTAGPVPDLKDRIQGLIDTAPCNFYQVQAASLMAEYYLSLGQVEAALPCLRFAIKKAPKLAAGQRAEDRLARVTRY